MSELFSDSAIKLTDLSSLNDRAELVLDIFMVRVLVSLSVEKSTARISQDTNIPIGQVRESVAKLVEKGLVELVRGKPKVLDRKFFDTLTAVLARVIGPIAPILIDDAISDLRLERAHFPVNRVAELIGLLSSEIQQAGNRLSFQKSMMKLIRKSGYLEGTSAK
jgi:hypothetical protein